MEDYYYGNIVVKYIILFILYINNNYTKKINYIYKKKLFI